MLKGVAASSGIAIGPAYFVKEPGQKLPRYSLPAEKIPAEKARLLQAFTATQKQLEDIRDDLAFRGRPQEAAIFEAHLLLLADPILADAVNALMNQGLNAEAAVSDAGENCAALFDGLEDEYLRERGADIRDICGRWLSNLTGKADSFQNLSQPSIIFARCLAPSQAAMLDESKVLAIVTETGGKTCHSAIIARAMEIPAVVGVGPFDYSLADGRTVIVDGKSGNIFLNPDPRLISEYRQQMQQELAQKAKMQKTVRFPAQTRDGKEFQLAANISSPEDMEKALASGAQGVGLYRTEFLYMDRPGLPTEEEQVHAYRTVLEAFPHQPVIIRTLDIGGDKELPSLQAEKELNPFLGVRGIRLCLARPGIFKIQLRAILRAGLAGAPWIMLPMVTVLEEVRRTKVLLKEAESELTAEGLPFSSAYKLGIMVETPAAAVLTSHFAPEVDFFSIGTNDLTQYTCAADRTNEKVTHLHDSFHPAVLQLIETVINSAHERGKPVGMCGEMAADPLATPLLAAMGLDEFSLSPAHIPLIKEVIRGLDVRECQQLWQQARQLADGREIRSLLEQAATI
jgi:phosphotransferase system enzyme I (PtsI)